MKRVTAGLIVSIAVFVSGNCHGLDSWENESLVEGFVKGAKKMSRAPDALAPVSPAADVSVSSLPADSIDRKLIDDLRLAVKEYLKNVRSLASAKETFSDLSLSSLLPGSSAIDDATFEDTLTLTTESVFGCAEAPGGETMLIRAVTPSDSIFEDARTDLLLANQSHSILPFSTDNLTQTFRQTFPSSGNQSYHTLLIKTFLHVYNQDTLLQNAKELSGRGTIAILPGRGFSTSASLSILTDTLSGIRPLSWARDRNGTLRYTLYAYSCSPVKGNNPSHYSIRKYVFEFENGKVLRHVTVIAVADGFTINPVGPRKQ